MNVSKQQYSTMVKKISPNSKSWIDIPKAFVIGGIIYVIVSLLYSQAYYIMLDFPGYSVRQIMSGSRNIMKGHKGRLFYICVTLIPYYLLGFLSCGIALFWVIPYTKVILTNFYLDLVHAQSSSLI